MERNINFNDMVGKDFTWDYEGDCTHCGNSQGNYDTFRWDEHRQGWWQMLCCATCTYTSREYFISLKEIDKEGKLI